MRYAFVNRVIRPVAAVAIVAAVIGVCHFLQKGPASVTAPLGIVAHIDPTTVAMLLVLAVLAVSAMWGMLPAAAASVAAGLGFDYFFLPPYGLGIDHPEHWTALVALLITAIVTSHYSINAERRAREAAQRSLEMERLYQLGRVLLLADSYQAAIRQVVNEMPGILGAACVTFYDAEADRIHRAESRPCFVADEDLRAGRQQVAEPSADARIVTVRFGDRLLGRMGLCGAPLSDAACSAIAGLVAFGLERGRALEAAARAEAMREGQELKSAILDSMAHNFNTPLTSIKAAVSSMIEDDARPDPQLRELLTIIDEETDRLSVMVGRALAGVRLEAGMARLKKQPNDIGQVISESLREFSPALSGRPVDLELAESLPVTDFDGDMIKEVLGQLLDNAVKYSPAGSPVTIRADSRDSAIVVEVADRGSAIDPAERERVFDKFYRGRALASEVPGAGMGLAIARSIVKAHGGDIRVSNRPGGGSLFAFSLPVLRRE